MYTLVISTKRQSDNINIQAPALPMGNQGAADAARFYKDIEQIRQRNQRLRMGPFGKPPAPLRATPTPFVKVERQIPYELQRIATQCLFILAKHKYSS